MNRKKVLISIFALICAASLFAEEPGKPEEPKKEEQKKPEVKLEGKIFAEYKQNLEKDVANYYYGFAVTRAYLTGKAKIDDVWSAKITIDAGNIEALGKDGDDPTKNVTTTSRGYEFFVKNAYVQAAPSFGDYGLVLQFGMIGTPIIGLIDDISDYRWVYNNYIDKAGDVLINPNDSTKSLSIDTSADLGASLKIDIMKYGDKKKNAMVSVTGAVMNGEGYKKTDESTNGYRGKAMYAQITVNPIAEVFISGYMRREAYAATLLNTFYGGTIGYDSKIIKAGVSYIMGKKGELTDDEKYTILDLYVNANLNDVAGLPVLIMGRYAMGSYKQGDTISTSASKVTVMAIGAGYQFNDYVRFLAYYENKQSKAYKALYSDDGDLQAFYVKSEIKF